MSSPTQHTAINGATAPDALTLFDAQTPQVSLPVLGPQPAPTGQAAEEIDFCASSDDGQEKDKDGDEKMEDSSAPEQTAPEQNAPYKRKERDEDEEMNEAPPSEPNAPRKRRAVDPAPAGDSDEEMKDAEPQEQEQRIYFDRSTAPDALREQLLRLDASYYPDNLEIGEMGPDATYVQVPMTEIFEFRGSDINKRFLPDDLAKGGRAMTMIELSGEIIGQHLEISLAEAKEKDDVPQPTQATGKGKGKQPAPAPVKRAPPPKDECVKAKFHLDTQTPHIEITTIDPDTDNVISTRIWAHEFLWLTEAPWLGFMITQVQPLGGPMDDTDVAPGLKALHEMMDFQKTAVVRAAIRLKSSRVRYWDGISASSLAAIRAKPDKSKVRDMLITGLDCNQRFCLYFSTLAGQGKLTKWTQRLDGYFRNLLMVAKEYGNLWFYRGQAERSGEGQDAIEKPALPKATGITPRWLGKEWTAIQVTDRHRNVRYKNVELHKWVPLEFPGSYEDVNEAAFLLKLAAREERDTQRRQLRELVRSDGTRYFRARFNCVNQSPWQYSVEVYLGTLLNDAKLRIPAPGTRIQLSVDKNNANPPRKRDLMALKGQVVFDAVDTDATFVCVVDTPGLIIPYTSTTSSTISRTRGKSGPSPICNCPTRTTQVLMG
jgi:hypothetical protein